MALSEDIKQQIIYALSNNKPLPNYLQSLLFPIEHKEYILNYAEKMRKEDVLANFDDINPCPLQTDKVFNGEEHPPFNDGWRNLLVFGDNLQLLKTIYENKDPLIKDKVKGKVKLIYIDPPFATEDEFKNTTGAKAYNDKKKGSEFIEFIRRRLIIAKEILAEDGTIFVHLDTKMVHYIKIIMDEIFGKNNFRNEIIWHYKSSRAPLKDFQSNHNVILRYTKSSNPKFNILYGAYAEATVKRFDKVDAEGKRYKIVKKRGAEHIVYMKEEGTPLDDVWYSQIVNGNSTESCDYPTQKPEKLLERIILSSTLPGDIVLDFFGGSGTTTAVAEKLGRKWIACDIGKLAYYTMQKRILTIHNSKIMGTDTFYGKKARSFITAQLGLYDLEKTLDLDFENYKHFVSHLFGFEMTKKVVGGIQFQGFKQESLVHIFNFKEFKDSFIDEDYLYTLHESIGTKTNGTVYIVSPISFCPSIDYYEIGEVRYYFLKVPYHVIKELHKKSFERSKQPKSKDNVNDLDYAVGFHFINPPKVSSKFTVTENNLIITINNFKSSDSHNEDIRKFSDLSSILIDKNYQDGKFILSEAFFHDDLMKNDCSEINISFKLEEIGNSIKIIYTDIYGNEFLEVINIS